MWLWGLEWNGKTRFSRLDWLYRERVCWRDTGERIYTCIYGPVGIISGGGSLVGTTIGRPRVGPAATSNGDFHERVRWPATSSIRGYGVVREAGPDDAGWEGRPLDG